MYKLLLIAAMMTVWLFAHLIQVEEEIAMKTLYQGKRAVNRAAHAAAQQLDKVSLGDGVVKLDSIAAAEAAKLYLQRNLWVDENGVPLEDTFLRDPVEILVFEVVNADQKFPYRYVNDRYSFEAVLERPGVVLIVKVVFPRAFHVMRPLEWELKGVAELVVG
ncbi:hypothetical protein ACFQZE_12375 [Paenibacillus sp. GCM10027627]|uniref:hypothetical protein n=1 Tax=unclassified Paenibacillus TaxID=185978 RepID=UPI0036444BF6